MYKEMIDFHTHIYPPNLPDYNKLYGSNQYVTLEKHDGETWMISEGKKFRRIHPNCYDLDERIKEMDKTNVQKQVLSIVPILFHYNVPKNEIGQVVNYMNDFLAACVEKYPDRFMALGSLPMQDPQRCLFEIECMGDRLIGYQIGSNINGKNLDNEIFYPIWEEMERRNLVLFVHPWDMMGQEEMVDYWLPWLVGMPAETTRAICSMMFGGIFDKYPKLKVVFAHGGGSFCGTIGRIQHGYEVRPDLCACKCKLPPKKYCGKFWTDSLVHSPNALIRLKNLIGDDRIVLGTDYPFPLGEKVPGSILKEAKMGKKINDKIRKGNLLDLLK